VAVEPETAALTPIAVVGLSIEQEQQWWASLNGYSPLSLHLPPSFGVALRAGEAVLLDSTQTPVSIWQYLSPSGKLLMVPMCLGEALVGVLKVDCGAGGEEYACLDKQALVRAVARLGALVLDRERLLRERAEARASELALREATQQMDTFLGMAGHELKTPLTSIKLVQQLAERRVRHLIQRKPEIAGDLAPLLEQSARAGRQTERLDRLVNDLLDVSRVQAGKLELYTEPADLTTIVHDAVEEQRQITPTRTLILQIPADLHAPVIADAARIGQAVTNYLTNALKYSAEDCPVEIGIVLEDQQARVLVRDEGPGLPAEEQDRIWECFHRVKGIEVQSGTGIGLGLGLHICRTIIERHHGQVGVESVPGQGSTFWFTLPLDSQAAHILHSSV
jgi:signal transduction histidine kinase